MAIIVACSSFFGQYKPVFPYIYAGSKREDCLVEEAVQCLCVIFQQQEKAMQSAKEKIRNIASFAKERMTICKAKVEEQVLL